jgi:hypothetical protein
MVCTATELFESACQKMHPHFDRAFNEAGTPCLEGRTTGFPLPLFCPALNCRGPSSLGEETQVRKGDPGIAALSPEVLSQEGTVSPPYSLPDFGYLDMR